MLFDAGVDVHRDDALGRLALSDEGLRRRELLVGGAAWATGWAAPACGCISRHQRHDACNSQLTLQTDRL